MKTSGRVTRNKLQTLLCSPPQKYAFDVVCILSKIMTIIKKQQFELQFVKILGKYVGFLSKHVLVKNTQHFRSCKVINPTFQRSIEAQYNLRRDPSNQRAFSQSFRSHKQLTTCSQ